MKVQYDAAYNANLAIFAIRVDGSDREFELPSNIKTETDHYLHTMKYILYKVRLSHYSQKPLRAHFWNRK